MHKKTLKARLSKAGVSALLLGVAALGSGCEAAEGIKLTIQTTAATAVTEAVGGIIAGAIDSIVGTVIPNANGA